MRRILEVVFSVVALLAFGVLFPFLAIAIKLDSKGSIFYTQTRVGMNRKLFSIYKLRTMVYDAEKNGPQLSKVDDSRVTLVGRFLRASKLDEFPQFYNVICGDMSLIGPRPERPEFVEMYESIPNFNTRFSVSPGITGLAQIRNGYDTGIESVRRKVKFEEFYVKNETLALDLEILWSTIKVCFGRG